MKIIKLITIAILTLFCISATATASWAGSRQQHRWEGVAIGLGAAILGHAIYQNHQRPAPEPDVVYRERRPGRYYHGKHYRSGHWKYKKVWRPPVYERVWNPGHYVPNGRWIPGRWIEIKKSDGHWVKEKVWIAHNGYDDYEDE